MRERRHAIRATFPAAQMITRATNMDTAARRVLPGDSKWSAIVRFVFEIQWCMFSETDQEMTAHFRCSLFSTGEIQKIGKVERLQMSLA